MKKIFILLSLLMIIPLMSCNDVNENTQVIVIWTKSINRPQVGDYVIDSYNELSKHIYNDKLSLEEMDEIMYFYTDREFNSLNIDKYDEEFFKNNSLVFLVHEVGTSLCDYKVKNININDGIIKIKLKRKCPYAVNDDIVNCTVVIEMSKEEVSSIINTQIIINNKIVEKKD